MPRRPLVVAFTALSVALTACAGSAEPTATDNAATAAAVPAGGERTGAVPTSAPSGTSFSFKADDGSEEFDFASYDDAMNLALGAINEYWIETMPTEFGVAWTEPEEFIAYYPPEQDGPSCGGQPVGAENAVYCNQTGGDFIAWDEPGLMVPYFEEYGDMANAVILAHEFGHGAQARLGLSDQFAYTIESELQADCFAGAWAAWADEQGLLGQDAADQAADAVISVADPEGVPWTDPDAHGTADERLEAFAAGVDGGAGGCVDTFYPGFSEEG
jgi:hypothetical protein